MCIFPPGDALKRRFPWFPDWVPKVQRNVKETCKSGRSRPELSNVYFIVKFCSDTVQIEFAKS